MKLRFEKINKPTQERYINFLLSDKKGRTIGARVYRSEMNAVQLPEDAKVWNCGKDVKSPGHYFTACVRSTRFGKNFGASQPFRYFKTEAGREAYIQSRLNDMKYRAAK